MKRKIFTVLDSLKSIWSDTFLKAIYDGKIYVKGKEFHMEINERDHIISVSYFKMNFQKAFDKVYSENLYPIFEFTSLSSEQVETVCVWLNPALGQLGIDGFEEYKERLKNRYCKDGKNYEEYVAKLFKRQLRSTFATYNDKKRRRYIEYLMPLKILELTDLIDLEYYKDIPDDDILAQYRDEEGNFSLDDSEALSDLSVKKIIELNNSKHKPSTTKIKRYIQFIPVRFLIIMAGEEIIPYKYLEYSSMEKRDVFRTRYEILISLLDNMDKFPERLRITSQDILDEYGKLIDGTLFYKLSMYGYVDSKQVIDVIGKNKVLRLSGYPEENLFEDEEVLAFYSSTRLSKMFLEDDIDIEFVEKYKKELNDDKIFQKKSETTIEEIKSSIMNDSKTPDEDKDDKVQESLLRAYDIGLCTPEVLKENISSEYIEQQYLDRKISDDYILGLYEHGVIGLDIIRNYFSESEMFDFYLQGKIDRDIISTFKNKDKLNENIENAIMNDVMPLGDVVALYFNGTLTIDDLIEAREFSESDFDFSTCIDENTEFSKIKEMFERKIIDYSCVTNLKNIGIITEEQLEELKQTMDKESFFDELKGKTFKLVTNRKLEEKGEKGGNGGHTRPKEDDLEKYNKEKELISRILGLDDIHGNIEEYATIESYNDKGRATSLNGYKVFGSRDNGLVIFAKFQKENAVFIMPFYQAAYFLDTRGQEGEQDIITQDRMKDKFYLRQLNQVEVISHTEYFARNLIEAACRLSPEYAEKYEGDETYKAEVEKLCQEMRADYRDQRNLN